MSLTYDKLVIRPVLVPLNRPVVSRVGLFEEWPLILIDLHTKEGVIGRSYLEPYIAKSARYLVPMLEDLSDLFEGKSVAPVDDYKTGINSLHLVGREGSRSPVWTWPPGTRSPKLRAYRYVNFSVAALARCPPITPTVFG